MNNIAAIILAAGKGVRMQSDLPKVFHKLGGKPLLQHVIETAQNIGIKDIYVVVGHKKELLVDYFKGWPVKFISQDEQLGTGHAVLMAQPFLKDFNGTVLVLAGDVPLLSAETLNKLIDFHVSHKAAATDLTAKLDDAGNYGRIVRGKDGKVLRIVEKKDASAEELQIQEINSGTFCFNSEDLFSALTKLKPENAQKEHYLTDTIEILNKMDRPVFAYMTGDFKETLGINTKEELAALEARLK
ncbi:NTP transferase domain-containing protein [Candidatus Saganbacteria bacterium]|nr:NTP transferase domain-containing protein [Candidatus Saganbacteria bacterium]